MKTSSSNSNAAFSRGYYLWVVMAALVVSLILYWAFRQPGSQPDNEGEVAATTTAQIEPAADKMVGIQPPSFQQISEYKDGARQRLRLSGNAEPDAVVILTDRGKRLRQVRVNEKGQWGATLDAEFRDVESGLMVLYAELYLSEAIPSIQSEETIIRLFPEGEDTPLVVVTAPGSPSRIIQSPFGAAPTSGPLGLSVIDYDHSGGVIITGTSSIPGRIRVYAQDSVIGETGIGVSGRWNYIAGRMLPTGNVEIKAELIAAQGIPNAPEGPVSISVPFSILPPLRDEATDGAVTFNREPLNWQIRRTLVGGGGQSTVIFSPDVTLENAADIEVKDNEAKDSESKDSGDEPETEN